MDSEKVGSCSESSSEEQSDRSCDQVKEDDSDSKRCYECIFCKRGFTNAQALGGHMNIHRKDRANKAKKTTSSSSDLQSNKQIHQSTFTNTPYLSPLLVRSQVNYQASPSNPHGYFPELADSNIMNLWGSDLSLQIGPSTRPLWHGDGVDLELRLGHHP